MLKVADYCMAAKLQNLIQKDNDLRVFCSGCHHCWELDVDALISRFGSGMELREIGEWPRRVECGSKGGGVSVAAVRWRTSLEQNTAPVVPKRSHEKRLQKGKGKES
jgi:hypothetical protein